MPHRVWDRRLKGRSNGPRLILLFPSLFATNRSAENDNPEEQKLRAPGQRSLGFARSAPKPNTTVRGKLVEPVSAAQALEFQMLFSGGIGQGRGPTLPPATRPTSVSHAGLLMDRKK